MPAITIGPLIKSEAEGVAQVIDDLSNPLVIPMQYAVAEYSQFVSTCRSSTGFVALPNTVLTPDRTTTPPCSAGRGGCLGTPTPCQWCSFLGKVNLFALNKAADNYLAHGQSMSRSITYP